MPVIIQARSSSDLDELELYLQASGSRKLHRIDRFSMLSAWVARKSIERIANLDSVRSIEMVKEFAVL